jgi:hypothetical protein
MPAAEVGGFGLGLLVLRPNEEGEAEEPLPMRARTSAPPQPHRGYRVLKTCASAEPLTSGARRVTKARRWPASVDEAQWAAMPSEPPEGQGSRISLAGSAAKLARRVQTLWFAAGRFSGIASPSSRGPAPEIAATRIITHRTMLLSFPASCGAPTGAIETWKKAQGRPATNSRCLLSPAMWLECVRSN